MISLKSNLDEQIQQSIEGFVLVADSYEELKQFPGFDFKNEEFIRDAIFYCAESNPENQELLKGLIYAEINDPNSPTKEEQTLIENRVQHAIRVFAEFENYENHGNNVRADIIEDLMNHKVYPEAPKDVFAQRARCAINDNENYKESDFKAIPSPTTAAKLSTQPQTKSSGSRE